jgi:hypothetical protein
MDIKVREDNITFESLTEDLARQKVTIKEYVARSEHTNLFTVAINKKILDNFKTHPSVWNQVFDVVNKGDGEGRTVRFPTLYGINPVYVPELSEIPFGDMDDTATTVEAVKLGIRMGISQEMIDDNEVGLMEWMIRRTGQRMAILRDQESFKALDTYNATGAAVDGTINTYIGNQNRGAYYTTGTFTNQQSASAANWEQILNTAVQQMKDQSITFGGRTYKIPVYVDTIIANSVRDIALRKLLRSATIVQATGVGDTNNASVTQVAANNIWNGMLNVITTPYVGRGQAYLMQAKRGLVLLDRKAPAVDQNANWAIDAQEIKALTRFMPAVIEERSIFSILLGTA